MNLVIDTKNINIPLDNSLSSVDNDPYNKENINKECMTVLTSQSKIVDDFINSINISDYQLTKNILTQKECDGRFFDKLGFAVSCYFIKNNCIDKYPGLLRYLYPFFKGKLLGPHQDDNLDYIRILLKESEELYIQNIENMIHKEIDNIKKANPEDWELLINIFKNKMDMIGFDLSTVCGLKYPGKPECPDIYNIVKISFLDQLKIEIQSNIFGENSLSKILFFAFKRRIDGNMMHEINDFISTLSRVPEELNPNINLEMKADFGNPKRRQAIINWEHAYEEEREKKMETMHNLVDFIYKIVENNNKKDVEIIVSRIYELARPELDKRIVGKNNVEIYESSKNSGDNPFILIQNLDNTYTFFTRPTKEAPYHYDLFNIAFPEYRCQYISDGYRGLRCKIEKKDDPQAAVPEFKGGFINVQRDKRTIKLRGYSQVVGRADYAKVKEILQKSFPDWTIEI